MVHVGGRPRTRVERRLEDYPPPTPQPTPCRLWQGAVDRDGYGILTANNLANARVRAHRWVWISVNGPIEPGLVVRHRCDNRVCFRLSHLELGTVADNNNDTRTRDHLGPVLTLRPSEIAKLFSMRDGGHTFIQIAQTINNAAIERGDRGVSRQTIERIYALGRDSFDEHWQRIYPDREDPMDKYREWRNR